MLSSCTATQEQHRAEHVGSCPSGEAVAEGATSHISCHITKGLAPLPPPPASCNHHLASAAGAPCPACSARLVARHNVPHGPLLRDENVLPMSYCSGLLVGPSLKSVYKQDSRCTVIKGHQLVQHRPGSPGGARLALKFVELVR